MTDLTTTAWAGKSFEQLGAWAESYRLPQAADCDAPLDAETSSEHRRVLAMVSTFGLLFSRWARRSAEVGAGCRAHRRSHRLHAARNNK